MNKEKKEMVELINNKFTINDIQMLTALTNLYNSLPNQCYLQLNRFLINRYKNRDK